MKALTKSTQEQITPTAALQMLIDGNARFVQNKMIQRDLQEQIADTSEGQFPFAAILSCIDSRVPAEIVFDQGIGDVFSARVAGNIVNEDVLGSIEYACKVAGSKIVVVMGHTKCGAVTAACNNVELGNITALLSKIKPAVKKYSTGVEMDEETIERVAVQNVLFSIEAMKSDSPILAEMVESNEILIVGAIYNVSNGQVKFID
jgi:carbonic anhydrase|tara:strand:- start:93 stop:704 length:612 start_codon:yes stop_codon:yes gene_type:complete